MIRFIAPLALGLSVLLLFGNFQCAKDDYYEAFFLLRDWQSAWLNNSGNEPVVSENPIPRTAFGLRLSARLSNDGKDTLRLATEDGFFLAASHPLRQIEIFSADAFDTIAAGENISRWFRVRYTEHADLDYLPLNDADRAFNYPPVSPEGVYHIDLLMIEPPSQPGDYHFSIKIQFDSLVPPLNRDTTFSLPTLQLQ